MTTYPNDTHASEHFSWREFACKCGKCTLPAHVKKNILKLVPHLEALRKLAGGPLHIFSAYRCPPHNKAVGGAENSQHMLGTATDLGCKTKTPRELANLADSIPAFAQGGVGVYPGFTHVDNRGHKARW